MKTIIEMAREAGFNKNELAYLGDNFARFAELVTEQANAQANASWTSMCNKMVGFEREACAKVAALTVCDTHIPTGIKIYGTAAAKAIMARGNT